MFLRPQNLLQQLIITAVRRKALSIVAVYRSHAFVKLSVKNGEELTVNITIRIVLVW